MVVISLFTSGVTRAFATIISVGRGSASTKHILPWLGAVNSACSFASTSISLSGGKSNRSHKTALDSTGDRGGPWPDVKGNACPLNMQNF